MTSQREERTWIRTGGYGRFRGEWVNNARYAGFDIGTRLLTKASSKMVGQVQINNYMPGLASTVFILARYINSKLTSLFTFHLKIIYTVL